MFKVGDRVEQRDFAGHHGMRGEVIGVFGSMVHIRWDDGHESSVIPGPGALELVKPQPVKK